MDDTEREQTGLFPLEGRPPRPHAGSIVPHAERGNTFYSREWLEAT